MERVANHTQKQAKPMSNRKFEKMSGEEEGDSPVPLDVAAPKDSMVLMVCVDGSEHANRAFQKALSLKHESDKLYICNCCSVDDPAFLEELEHVDPGQKEKYVTALHERGKKLCQHYIEECQRVKAPNCHVAILTGPHPKSEVCQFAKEKGVDTIFIGPRGLGKIKRMLLGSFSQYILHHVQCDVVLVK